MTQGRKELRTIKNYKISYYKRILFLFVLVLLFILHMYIIYSKIPLKEKLRIVFILSLLLVWFGLISLFHVLSALMGNAKANLVEELQ